MREAVIMRQLQQGIGPIRVQTAVMEIEREMRTGVRLIWILCHPQ